MIQSLPKTATVYPMMDRTRNPHTENIYYAEIVTNARQDDEELLFTTAWHRTVVGALAEADQWLHANGIREID